MLINLRPIILFAALCTANVVEAQTISSEQNYAINSPGVALVQTVFTATVYVNKVKMKEERFQQLVDSVKKLDTTGTLMTAQQKLDIVVRALYKNPLRYLTSSNEYFRQAHRITSSGTGFFITGDGYLITNCHIIDRDSAYIRKEFIISTFKEVTETNIRSLELSWEMTLTEEQRELLSNAYSVMFSQVSSLILFDLTREIYVLTRTDSARAGEKHGRMPAEVVIKGKAMPGKDVAILKVTTPYDMPTLMISKNATIRIGEQVLVYGYPEPVSSNAFLAKETETDPTLTAGIVSAIKKSVGGWPVIQMDAAITHGSSGSPVCDNGGNVIGLATFGTLEQKTGSLASSYNFAIPVSVINEYLDSARVIPAMSKVSHQYNQALDYFFKGYYYKALLKLESVEKTNPDYPGLAYYKNECHQLIDAGEDQESFFKTAAFRVLAILVIIGGIWTFYKWQQKKRTAL